MITHFIRAASGNKGMIIGYVVMIIIITKQMNVEDGWRNRFIGMKMNTAVDGREV
jgi:hypothetical protein